MDEILLASRLETYEGDVGTIEPVDLIGLAAEECARVDADPGPAVHGRAGSARHLQAAAPRRAQPAGETRAATARAPSRWSWRARTPWPRSASATMAPAWRRPTASASSRSSFACPAQRALGRRGPGLALVRSIAQRHGGSVHCEGRADGQPGACFVLRLPLA